LEASHRSSKAFMEAHLSSQSVEKTEALSVMDCIWPDQKIRGPGMQKSISDQNSSCYFKYSEKVFQNYAWADFRSGWILSIHS